MSHRQRTLWITTAIYWIFIAIMTHLPRVPAIGKRVGDKTAHFGGYALLAALLYVSIWMTWPRSRLAPLAVMGIIMVYAALDELTQPWVGRHCDFRDWVADVSGAAAALLPLIVWHWFSAYRLKASDVQS